jgi:hypothetical protein
MSERKIDAEMPPGLEAGEVAKCESDPSSVSHSEVQEKDPQEPGGRFELAGRIVWRRPSVALVELGVCASWCALVSRGPSASISRFGLRTSGSATWVFARPRCADVGCATKPGMSCSAHPWQSRR